MSFSSKRKLDSTENMSKRIKNDNCPHGNGCYRKNPHHFKEYDHPHLNVFIESDGQITIPDDFPQPKSTYLDQIAILKSILPKISTDDDTRTKQQNSLQNSFQNTLQSPTCDSVASSSVVKTSSFEPTKPFPSTAKSTTEKCTPGSMLDKLQKCSPYNLFFTTIPKSPATSKETNGITFTDLLCPSLGELKCSLQINFMIDISWLLEQYKARNLEKKPLTILYGDEFPKMEEYMNRFCPSVKYKFVKMKDPFGCHHSKIGIYVYEDKSIRVVVSTANLYYEDWNHYNQGLWVSPACPQLADSCLVADGESPTGFKDSLLAYLKHYKFDILKEWIEYVEKADFSAIRVFLVYSAPGKHYPKNNGSHLHRVGNLLSQHCMLPAKTTPQSEGPLSWGVIAQASSLGSMGKSPAEWLRGFLLRSLASHKQGPLPNSSNATLSLIYPSVDNVMTGYFGPESGGCLPYSKATNEKQRWLQDYMHQWKADGLTRSRAMPHIKSYCRVSPCLTKLAYFLLTSANISKSAWGGNIQKDSAVYVRSYEMGVMFLPKYFDEEYFEIRNTLNNKNKSVFPIMYDLPLIPFKKSDYPWCN